MGFVHYDGRCVREYCVFRVILSPSLLLFPFRPLFVFIWSLVGFPLPSLIRFVHSLYVLRCNIIVSFHSIYHPHCPHPIAYLRIRLSGDKVWIKWVDKVSLFSIVIRPLLSLPCLRNMVKLRSFRRHLLNSRPEDSVGAALTRRRIRIMNVGQPDVDLGNIQPALTSFSGPTDWYG